MARFEHPEADDRSMPFWAWNGTMTRDLIRFVLEHLHRAGFGGAFVHPRPGLTNAYLSEDWFQLWGYALETAKGLGLRLQIYDENTYPTGYAGGHIMNLLPDCAARACKVYVIDKVPALSTLLDETGLPEDCVTPIRVYAAQILNGTLRLTEDVTGLPPHALLGYGPLVALIRQPAYTSAWYGGFPNTDLLRPEVTRALIQTTYEAYNERFGSDFGGAIQAAFSDEPGISPGTENIEDPMTFPFSDYLSGEFFMRNGYSLEDNMASLALDIERTPGGVAAKKVRFDYYSTLRALWSENFAEPLSSWCSAHGIAWTGHFLDENWPYPWGYCSPAVMSMYEHMHWPGVDMLMSYMLKTDGESPMLLTLKELSSAGCQLQKARLLCECYGAGGYDAGIQDFKRMADWLLASGITLLTQHMVFSSITGVRKHHHPPCFDWREPWWMEFPEINEYFARLCYALSMGQAPEGALLLHPTTSWFLRRPADARGNLLQTESSGFEEDMRAYVDLVQHLARRQIAFELGDEFLMAHHARVEGGALWVGARAYHTVIIPAQMKNMCSSTYELLRDASLEGVRLVSCGKLPDYLDGTPANINLPSMTLNEDVASLLEAIQGVLLHVAPGVKGIYCNRRMLDDGGELCFVVNGGPKPTCCRLSACGAALTLLNAFSGAEEPYPFQGGQDGTIEAEIVLSPCESILLRAYPGALFDAPPVRFPRAAKGKRIQLKLVDITPETDNALMIDYCRLRVGGRIYPDTHVLAATERIYHAHGFKDNPWDMAIQFENRIISHNHFVPDSGFSASFRFTVKDVPERALLAAEHPELFHLTLNGLEAHWKEDTYWLDHQIGQADVSGLLVPGNNEVVLTVQPFNVLAELQPIYVLGHFAVTEHGNCFAIEKAQKLQHGALTEQGMPFYSGRIRYCYEVELDAGFESVRLLLPDYQATALSVFVNGKQAFQSGIGMNPDIGMLLHAGRNQIELALSCSLKNLFGPHHSAENIRNRAWPGAWRKAPENGQPPASAYDRIGYGLLTAPTLEL